MYYSAFPRLRGLWPSVLELDDRRAAAALVLRGGVEAGDQRVALQELGDGAAQLPGAMPVDDAQLADVGDRCLIEELFETADRFVHGVADDVQLGERSGSRL